MSTALSGSGRVDDIKGHPQGEIRGLTNLVNITEDVRKYAMERRLTDAEAIESGMQEKRKEFLEKGAEVYAERICSRLPMPAAPKSMKAGRGDL